MYRLSELRRLGRWYLLMSYHTITGVDDYTLMMTKHIVIFPQECWWSTLADFEKPVMYFHMRSWFSSMIYFRSEHLKWLLFDWERHCITCCPSLSFEKWLPPLNRKAKHSTARFHQIGSEPPTTTKRRSLPLAGDVCERGGVMTS